jgi:hypothetical protein
VDGEKLGEVEVEGGVCGVCGLVLGALVSRWTFEVSGAIVGDHCLLP